MPAVGGDRRGRPAREPLAGDRRRRRMPPAPLAVPAARQHPRVRARSDDRRRADRARPRRARRLVRRGGRRLDRRACAAAARPSTSRSPGPSAPTSTPRWPGAPRTTRCSRSASSTGSAGRGSCSATAGARNGSWPRSTPPATRRRPATGPTRCCSRRGSKRRPVHLELAREPHRRGHRAGRRDRRRRPAGALLLLPRLRRVAPRRVRRRRWSSPTAADALYDGLDRPWDQAANWLFAARAAISAGDQERSVEAPRPGRSTGCASVDDPWLHVRRDAMLGELARIQHRFDDAVVHIGRAAETSRRLGFLQTEAYQLSSLGRAQCQAGDYDAGAATLRARDREGRGHRRRAPGGARPRASRARPAGARPDGDGAGGARGGGGVAPRRRRRRAGRARRVPAGRDGRRGPGRRAPRHGWSRSSTTPERDDDAPVEVFALDALARVAAEPATGDARTCARPTGAWSGRALHHRPDRRCARSAARRLRSRERGPAPVRPRPPCERRRRPARHAGSAR